MPARIGEAEWSGSLQEGRGTMRVESGALEGPYSFGTRFENAQGSNPEELIGAAHAGCFSQALSMLLGESGHKPQRIHTKATVHIDPQNGGFKITRIELDTEGEVLGLDAAKFEEYAQTAKRECPVSQALAGVDIELRAKLVG